MSDESPAEEKRNAPVADVVVVTRSHSLWCRIADVFEHSSGLPQFGALLLYLSFARPSSLGFIEDFVSIATKSIYPVSDLLRLSPRSPEAREHLAEVELDLTNPLFVSKRPFSSFTTITKARSLKKSPPEVNSQPANSLPLIAKLAWLSEDHFLKGRPVEELVLEQVKAIDPHAHGNVAQMRACHVLVPIAGQNSIFARTLVLIVIEGKGATMRQRPFRTVGDVFDYLEGSWRSECSYNFS